MKTKRVSQLAVIAVLVAFSTIQVAPSYAVLEEIGAGIDKLTSGIINELSNDQQATINIEGDDNEVNLNQDLTSKFEPEQEFVQVSSETGAETSNRVFKVNVIVNLDEEDCGDELDISVAWKQRTEIACDGDERSLYEQRNDPIVSEEYLFEFPRGEIQDGETFKVCVNGECEIVENRPVNAPEEVEFNI